MIKQKEHIKAGMVPIMDPRVEYNRINVWNKGYKNLKDEAYNSIRDENLRLSHTGR